MMLIGPLALGAVAMSVVMLLVWAWQLHSGNAGIVDVVWTWGVGLLSIVGLTFVSDGLPTRRLLLAALIGIWSVRLGGQLLWRVLHSPEDERYRQLKTTWGPSSQVRLLMFYESQAISTPLFALPLLLAGETADPLHLLDLIGVALWFVAIAGEWQADRQLAQFRADPSNRGKVCQQGWWRYSRHPNYFFEWLHWCSYVPLAITAPSGWLSLLTPAAMFYFLNYVTGIPPAETQALRSRGDAYRDYQRRTNAFFPGPSAAPSK